MTHAMTIEFINTIKQLFQDQGIEIKDQLQSPLSLNLIISTLDKNKAISVLHGLIK